MSIRGTVGLQPALRDEQLETPVCLCEQCTGEVYRGEKRIVVDGKRLCTDCFEESIGDWVRRNPQDFARTFGYDIEDSEEV